MKFTYYFETKSFYLKESDELDYESERFDYEPERDELIEGLAHCIYKLRFKNKNELSDSVEFADAVISGLRKFIDDADIQDSLAETYESDLEDWFYDIAWDEYKRR